MHFYYPKLRATVDHVVLNCDSYQQLKSSSRQYRHLPPRQVSIKPWYSVAVDLIGPWKIKLSDNTELEVNALTMVDTDTNFAEACRIDNKTSLHISEKIRKYMARTISSTISMPPRQW